jgi:hypothetical protein
VSTLVVPASSLSLAAVVSHGEPYTEDQETVMEHGTLVAPTTAGFPIDGWGHAGTALVTVDTTGRYRALEAFLAFDTSALGAGASISAAVLTILPGLAADASDYPTVEARLYDFGADVSTGDWVDGSDLAGLTLLAHGDLRYDFAGAVDLALTSDALAANINKTGTTRMVVVSAKHRALEWPSANQSGGLVHYDSADPDYRAFLTITYEAAAAGFPHAFGTVIA